MQLGQNILKHVFSNREINL